MSAAARVGESHPPALSFGSLKTSGFRTFSVSDIASMGAVAQRYTLAPVASRIKQPVLILAGAEDHFIPQNQRADFAKALVNAKSVTTQVFDRASGGHEHCQNGNYTLVHAAVFSWVEDTFGVA